MFHRESNTAPSTTLRAVDYGDTGLTRNVIDIKTAPARSSHPYPDFITQIIKFIVSCSSDSSTPAVTATIIHYYLILNVAGNVHNPDRYAVIH